MVHRNRAGGKAPSAVARQFSRDALAAARELSERVESGEGREWSLIFDIARAVRGLVGWEDYTPQNVAVWLYRNCEDLQAVLPGEEDFVAQYARAWKKVRMPEGAKPLLPPESP